MQFDIALNGKALRKGKCIMIYVVDTHALVWFLEGDSRLSETAYKVSMLRVGR
jgi:hypothetical protein